MAQAAENFGLFAELHDRVTADYRGEVPMVGFGAGAYVLALLDRGKPVEAACGEYADAAEAPLTPDGGAASDGSMVDPSNDGGPRAPVPGGAVERGGNGNCSCGVTTTSAKHVSIALTFIAFASALLRRGRGWRRTDS